MRVRDSVLTWSLSLGAVGGLGFSFHSVCVCEWVFRGCGFSFHSVCVCESESSVVAVLVSTVCVCLWEWVFSGCGFSFHSVCVYESESSVVAVLVSTVCVCVCERERETSVVVVLVSTVCVCVCVLVSWSLQWLWFPPDWNVLIEWREGGQARNLPITINWYLLIFT